MDNKGNLIVVEGACDGIGKTTQFNMLKDHLISDSVDVVTHHFPSYGTIQGKMIEKYLNGELGQPNEMSPYFINTLYAADRAYTWYSELREEYNQGKVILLDRYTPSSLIYQSALLDNLIEKQIFLNYVCQFEYCKLDIARPDLVIFLSASFDLVAKFRNNRKCNDGVSDDIHESNLEFMRKVYDNALFVSNYFQWDTVKCDDKDDMRSISDIHNDVYHLVKKRIKI